MPGTVVRLAGQAQSHRFVPRPAVGLELYTVPVLKFPVTVEQGNLHFHFPLAPAHSVDGLDHWTFGGPFNFPPQSEPHWPPPRRPRYELLSVKRLLQSHTAVRLWFTVFVEGCLPSSSRLDLALKPQVPILALLRGAA